MQRHTIAEVLAEAQARLRRLEPEEAVLASRQGWTLVDVRDSGAIARDGAIPGAVEIPLSVLEWRIDPASDTHLAAPSGKEEHLVLICQDGYSSSLAAASLVDLGLGDAGDVVGGFEAWRDAGLPVAPAPQAEGRPGMGGPQ